MTRKEEYTAMMEELEKFPQALDGTVERAMRRKKVVRRREWVVSAASFAACFVAFVLLVNLSVTFARACGTVPLLRELAKAVAWSPSLSAAVENEYVQPVEQSQTENGITAKIEYLIVDRKQVNVFYTLSSQADVQLEADGIVTSPDKGYFSSGSYGTPNGELRSFQMDFVEQDVPDTMKLTLRVWAQEDAEEELAEEDDDIFSSDSRESVILAEFHFELNFDPYYTAQGKTIPVNAEFAIGEQKFCLTEAEVYPTHLRFSLEADPENTAWLTELEVYVENERGERFEMNRNGILASGDPNGQGMGTFWLDSPFFSSSKGFTLYITGAKWRKKNRELTRIDLQERTAENLPQGVRFLGAERSGRECRLSFALPLEREHRMYSLFQSYSLTPDGKQQPFSSVASTGGVVDPATGERTGEEDLFTEILPLEDFYGDTVYLEPIFDHVTRLEEPVAVPIT